MDPNTTRSTCRPRAQSQVLVPTTMKKIKAEHWKIRGISPPPPAHSRYALYRTDRACKVKTSNVLRISRALLLCVAMILIITSFIVKFDDSMFLPIAASQNKQQRQSMLIPMSPSINHIGSRAAMTNTVHAHSSNQSHRWKPLNGSDDNDVGNAIFYNIYIPREEPTAAMSIVKEQLNQIQKSSQNNNSITTTTLYYNLIGPSNVREIMHRHNISFDSLIGNNNHQQVLKHVEEGGEDLTLDALWEYCLERPNATVAYIHDKGSLHANLHGVRRRRFHATAAALSEQCFGIGNDNSGGDRDGNNNKCNTCAASIHFQPHHYVPANMWTAKCSYIRQLVRPSTLSSKLFSMYRQIKDKANTSDFYQCLASPLVLAALDDHHHHHHIKSKAQGKPISSSLGVFRQANAHWLVLHPNWQPCSVYPASYLKYPPIQLKPEPTEPIAMPDEKEKQKPTHHPMFQTEGYLYKYQYLYNQSPYNTSWFWWYYKSLNGHDRCKRHNHNSSGH